MELTIEQTLQQGVAAHKEGKLQEAERLYRAILGVQPKHPDANHNLGLIAVSVNKAGAALPLFKTALEANPKIEQFWLSYIDALIKENQLKTVKKVLAEGRKMGLVGEKVDALEEQLKQIAQSAPSKLSEKKKSLTLKEKRKKISESKQQKKKKGESKNPNSASPPQSQLNNLMEQYQNGQYDEAEKLAVLITQQFPEHQFAWKVLGALFGQSGRSSEAVNANQRAVQLEPQDAEAHYNLGINQQELGKLGEAEASYKQSIALKSDYAEARNNLGMTLQAQGKLEEAEASYRQAIALKSDYAEAHSNLGNTLKELGRLEEAEASYRQAIALKPDYAEARNNLGSTLKELGRLEEAEASLRQAIALKPDYAEARNNLGNTLQELGRLEEAEASLRQAIALKPDFAAAHYNLGINQQELGRLEEAEASYKQSIALKSDYAEAHNNLGITLQELGRLEEAEANYRQAINLKSNYAGAHSNLGATLQGLGRIEEAEASCRQAITLKPDYAEAYRNLGIVLYISGDIDSGLESLEKAKNIDPNLAPNEVILTILQARKARGKTEVSANNISNLGYGADQFPLLLVLNRIVEAELITRLYKMKSIELDKFDNGRISDPRYGNGKCSRDFNLFKDGSSIIKSVAEDLIIIMREAVKSDIYIGDSFFNIIGAGAGTTPHAHTSRFDTDKYLNFAKQKYSLVYYLSVGDQNCSDPGVLKLYDPSEDILPCEGMIVIIPAGRKHSAVYGGEKIEL